MWLDSVSVNSYLFIKKYISKETKNSCAQFLVLSVSMLSDSLQANPISWYYWKTYKILIFQGILW